MQHVVLYAKFVDDKEIGILMTGIFFGGIADSEREADEIGRRCVSSVQGGQIIPKISPIVNGDLQSTIKDMVGQFDKMADRMYENEQTVSRDD